MIVHVVECPHCWQSQWRATGHTHTHSRLRLTKAELICTNPKCGRVFSSALPAALEAAAAARAELAGSPPPAPVQPPVLPVRKPTSPSPFESVGALATDFKRRLGAPGKSDISGEGDGA